MSPTVFVPDLSARGVAIEPQDALAIVQSLMLSLKGPASTDTVAPPGLLQADNLELRADGFVACAGYDVTPTVAEVAILLDALLARAPGRPPGGVRYAIARAVHDVDAPPFDTLGEFAQTLARHATGDPRHVVRALVARVANRAPWRPVPVVLKPEGGARAEPSRVERRRTGAGYDKVRRELREADRRAYEELERATLVAPAATMPVQRSRRASPWTYAAAAAAVLAVAAAGGMRHLHHAMPVPAISSRAPHDAATQDAGPARRAPEARHDTDAVTVEAARTDKHLPNETVASRTISEPRHPGDEGAGLLVRALDEDQRPIFSPAFASNGSAMFFHAGGDRERSSALMSSERGDDGLRVMTIVDDGARNYHVQPSPDGSQVAFDSDRDGERGVYVGARDGSHVKRVSGDGYAALPTWAPDGRSLTFVRAEPDDPRVWNLWRLWLESGEMQRLTAYRHGQTWSASWFRDGRRMCYTHEDEIVVRDLESGETRTFATPVKGHVVSTPAVSPDGTKVIIQVHRSGAWLLDLTDGSMRCVLTDPTAEEFAWTPDGRRVAFHSRRDGDWRIWVMAPG